MLIEGIEIVSNVAGKHQRLLRNDSHSPAEIMESNVRNVYTIDVDCPASRFNDAKKSDDKRGFSRPCSANNCV